MQRSLILPAIIFLFAATADAAHWPAWRGSVDGAGVTSEKNLPVEWSPTKNVRWSVPLPDGGNSTPIVWGHRLFLTQAVTKENRRTVMCFERTDGKLLWQSGVAWTEKEDTHEQNPYCGASPSTDGERVIATFGSAGVHCYDFEGRELWRRDLGKQQHDWGYGSSPVIHGELCFVYHGPGPGSYLVALDKKTGNTVWKFEEQPAKTDQRTDGFKGREPGYVGTWSTPIVVKASGREELVMSFPSHLLALEPKTGKVLWTCEGLNPLIYASPIFSDGLVVAMGGFFGSTVGVRPGGNGDVTGTARVWREERAKKNRCGCGVTAGGRIYLANMEGFVECIDLKSGQQLWEERLPKQGAKGESWSSMLRVGERIYAVNQSGDVIVMKAGPKFEVVATNSVGNEMTNASLVPSDGEFFLRTYQHLWCFAETKTSASAR